MSGNDRTLAELLRVRTLVEISVDALIAALDELDAKAIDLEESENDDVDEDNDDILEPSLGASEDVRHPIAWRRPDLFAPDLEADGPECGCGCGTSGR